MTRINFTDGSKIGKREVQTVVYETGTSLTFYEPTWKDLILEIWNKLTNHNRE